MNTTGNKKNAVAPPFAKKLTDEDIVQKIKKAEKGPFYTVDEVKELLKKSNAKIAKKSKVTLREKA